jgi:hypothetical protein
MVFTGSRKCISPSEIFRTYDPLTMMQMPIKPKNEGTSRKRRKDVPVNITGVNESMGMHRERSKDDSDLKISQRLIIFRIAVIATAE